MMPIHIGECGERLYVHPFSIGHRTSTVHYLDGNEQTPYDNDYIVAVDHSPQFPYMPLHQRLWYAVVKRYFVALNRVLHWWTEGWLPPFGLLDVFYTTAVPFMAESYPNIRLGLDYQLSVFDKERLTDTVHLVPSQGWIAAKVEEMLGVRDEYEHVEEDKAAFVLWRNAEQAKGNTIQFLVSIDS